MKYIGAGLAVLSICAMGAFCMSLMKNDICCALPIIILGCVFVAGLICEN